jgi:hypothetical protein
MRTRHLFPLAGLAGLAALALAAPAPASAASNAAKCSPKGSTAILASDTARVFQKRNAKKKQFDIYGCRYANGKVVKIGFTIPGDTIGVGSFRLAGKYVGLVYSDCDSCDDEIQVFDLTTGKKTLSTDAIEPSEDDDLEPGVIDFVMTPGGAVAWIAEGSDENARVVKLDKKGKARLDRQVESGSLAIAGNRIFWLKNGTPFTATLS